MRAWHRWAAVAALLVFAGLSAVADVERPVFDVPRLRRVAVDGDGSDWHGGGLLLETMAGPLARLYAPEDLAVTAHVGWTDEGLVVLVDVVDDTPIECDDDALLHENDCVEFFVADSPGSPNRYQVVVAPGRDPEFPRLRMQIHDHRPADQREPELRVEAVSSTCDEGYSLEVLLPWENLGVEPRMGDEAALNVIVSDSDVERGAGAQRDPARWFPSGYGWADPNAVHALRLSRRPGEPSAASAEAEVQLPRTTVTVHIAAAARLAGRRVTVTAPDGEEACGVLEREAGGARAAVKVAFPRLDAIPKRLAVDVEGVPALAAELPDMARELAWEKVDLEIRAGWYCFSEREFPPFYFAQPLLADNLLGPYSIEVEHYNAGFEPVEAPDEPGRYGAVVSVHLEDGRTTKRYRTLFHHPLPLHQWPGEIECSLRPPEGLGIAAEVVAAHAEELDRFAANRLFQWGLLRNPKGAAMLAGLGEREPGARPEGPWDGLDAADRQWWVTLKRKLDGMEERCPDPFVCPRPMEGEPAPVVRTGSHAEAGMKPGAADAIDAVLREWAADTDQDFAVCVARHGVIVLYRAYPVDHPDYTVNTPTWMASITKLLSGTLMMMLVDQGLVDLDDEVCEFLPALRGAETPTPLTVRRLYTHTNGLWGHWGDEMHDLEHVVATIARHLDVGARHEYNGAGYALGGKVIEVVSGEAIPQFYHKHLLGPLGLQHTHVTGTSGDAHSVPLDMAKIAQMLLNRGAYGDMRFFSEETFAKMMPASIEHLRTEAGPAEWGIGTTRTNPEPKGPNEPSATAFGHGAASAATLIIDPEWDLVVVMTRNSGGANFGKYHGRFLAAVYENIDR